jgi:feruloyl-CoA synthase
LFDGRIAEDFKLSTGTWASVGPLRARFIDHFAPFVRDVVLTGEGRDDIGALIFPDLVACRQLALDIATDAPPAAVLDDERVRAWFAKRLVELARESTGSSNCIVRALLMAEPPSLDKGELTDKGSINQRAVLASRADLVEELYADTPSPRVLTTKE